MFERAVNTPLIHVSPVSSSRPIVFLKEAEMKIWKTLWKKPRMYSILTHVIPLVFFYTT